MSLSQSFRLDNIKKIIAVSSGKGGVGKSTTAINLAVAMSQLGYRVGLLDADIYGPNQPHMLGVNKKPEITGDNKFKPVFSHGLQTMSMGYLVDENEPMIWRGPMVIKALSQLLYQTAWDNLDYLFIDMPPGTGDVQLTISQKVPVNGAIIVTTPQDVALLDVRKGVEMFRKVDVPIFGVIENMSAFHCPKCNYEAEIFGASGGEKMALDCGVPLLGKIPLQINVRVAADAGKPIVISHPEENVSKQYHEIAKKIGER